MKLPDNVRLFRNERHAQDVAAKTYRPDFQNGAVSITDPAGTVAHFVAVGTWQEPCLAETADGEEYPVNVFRRGLRLGADVERPRLGDTFIPLTRDNALELAHQLLDLLAGEGDTWE